MSAATTDTLTVWEINVQLICRTCLSEVNKDDSVVVTDMNEVHQKTYIQMIFECCRTELQLDDAFSSIICSTCASELSRFFVFKSQCKEAYETFQQLMLPKNASNKGIEALKVEFEDEIVPATDKCIQTEPIHTCEVCDKSFPSYSDMRSHRTKHKTNGYKCSKCDKNYTRLSYLKGHIAVNHPDAPQLQISYTKKCCCPVCYKQFTRPEHMQSHLSTHVEQLEWQSTQESKKEVTPTYEESEDDLKNEYEELEIEEEFLEEETNEYAEIDLPIKREIKTNYDYDNEDKSQEENTNSANYEVNYESASQDCKDEFMPNVEETGNESPPYVKVVGHHLTGKSKRGRPRKGTIRKKPKHTCDICNRSFNRSTHLTRHRNSHLNIKMYVCNVCTKGFTRSDHLNLHLYSHTDEKPYQCEKCNKGFIRSENYRKHVHVGHCDPVLQPKIYSCDYCGKSFSTMRYLKVHTDRHEKSLGSKYRTITECEDIIDYSEEEVLNLEENSPTTDDNMYQIIETTFEDVGGELEGDNADVADIEYVEGAVFVYMDE